MRSIGIALATALVGLSASVASAQQGGGVTMQMGGNGGLVITTSGSNAAVFSTGSGDGAVVSADILQGIALTGKQRDSVAKLDSVHVRAIAAADAQHIAAVRALLTDAQRTKFDENEANRKTQLELARKNMQEAMKNGQSSGPGLQAGQAGLATFQIQVDDKATTPANK